jgi:NADH:ubiquinone oxidoreductase subunit E
MGRLKVSICTGKRCRACGSEDLLLSAEGSLTAEQRRGVKLKDSGCLGYCGKKKHGQPPFVEVDDDVLGCATPDGIRSAIAAALVKRG